MRDTQQLLGVVGNPVSHSLSPQMHTAAIEVLDLPWTYQRCLALDDREARQHFSDVRVGLFLGLNVTTPFKQLALQACDTVSSTAQVAGGVNTLYIANDMLCGENTDGIGAVVSLEQDCGFTATGANVIVLGTGPTACVIAWTLGMLGAREVIIVSRDAVRSLGVASTLAAKAKEDQGGLSQLAHACFYGATYEDLSADIARCQSADAIVNATTLGMKPEDPSPLPQECFREGQAVLDVIYGTSVPTAFFTQAQQMGARISDGRGMLVQQGAASLAIWTGLPIEEIPCDVMRAAVDSALEERLAKARS